MFLWWFDGRTARETSIGLTTSLLKSFLTANSRKWTQISSEEFRETSSLNGRLRLIVEGCGCESSLFLRVLRVLRGETLSCCMLPMVALSDIRGGNSFDCDGGLFLILCCRKRFL